MKCYLSATSRNPVIVQPCDSKEPPSERLWAESPVPNAARKVHLWRALVLPSCDPLAGVISTVLFRNLSTNCPLSSFRRQTSSQSRRNLQAPKCKAWKGMDRIESDQYCFTVSNSDSQICLLFRKVSFALNRLADRWMEVDDAIQEMCLTITIRTSVEIRGTDKLT